jgi:hypothetical protein
MPPNGLRVSRAAPLDRKTIGPIPAFKMRPISLAASGVGCTRPSRRGVTPHQRNPPAPRASHLLPCAPRPAVETGHRTGADQPLLHPGSQAPVTPPLVAVATFCGRPRSPRYVRQVLGLVALSLTAILLGGA